MLGHRVVLLTTGKGARPLTLAVYTGVLIQQGRPSPCTVGSCGVWRTSGVHHTPTEPVHSPPSTLSCPAAITDCFLRTHTETHADTQVIPVEEMRPNCVPAVDASPEHQTTARA
jgi:hypothetical protein